MKWFFSMLGLVGFLYGQFLPGSEYPGGITTHGQRAYNLMVASAIFPDSRVRLEQLEMWEQGNKEDPRQTLMAFEFYAELQEYGKAFELLDSVQNHRLDAWQRGLVGTLLLMQKQVSNPGKFFRQDLSDRDWRERFATTKIMRQDAELLNPQIKVGPVRDNNHLVPCIFAGTWLGRPLVSQKKFQVSWPAGPFNLAPLRQLQFADAEVKKVARKIRSNDNYYLLHAYGDTLIVGREAPYGCGSPVDSARLFLQHFLVERRPGQKPRLKSFVARDLPDMKDLSPASVQHLTLNRARTHLVFARATPLGGLDLYHTRRVDGVWQEPVPLGPTINTRFHEIHPFFGSGDTLYFSSRGLPGAGGYDIYRLQFKHGQWHTPTNLGVEVNSRFDDMCYRPIAPGRAFFISNRKKMSTGHRTLVLYQSEPRSAGQPAQELSLADPYSLYTDSADLPPGHYRRWIFPNGDVICSDDVTCPIGQIESGVLQLQVVDEGSGQGMGWDTVGVGPSGRWSVQVEGLGADKWRLRLRGKNAKEEPVFRVRWLGGRLIRRGRNWVELEEKGGARINLIVQQAGQITRAYFVLPVVPPSDAPRVGWELSGPVVLLGFSRTALAADRATFPSLRRVNRLYQDSLYIYFLGPFENRQEACDLRDFLRGSERYSLAELDSVSHRRFAPASRDSMKHIAVGWNADPQFLPEETCLYSQEFHFDSGHRNCRRPIFSGGGGQVCVRSELEPLCKGEGTDPRFEPYLSQGTCFQLRFYTRKNDS